MARFLGLVERNPEHLDGGSYSFVTLPSKFMLGAIE
jgi:hypothetical protein